MIAEQPSYCVCVVAVIHIQVVLYLLGAAVDILLSTDGTYMALFFRHLPVLSLRDTVSSPKVSVCPSGVLLDLELPVMLPAVQTGPHPGPVRASELVLL